MRVRLLKRNPDLWSYEEPGALGVGRSIKAAKANGRRTRAWNREFIESKLQEIARERL